MAKILIVPDVHGRTFWHKAEELIDEVDQVVFLGDYLDPYPHEGISFDDALVEFTLILLFKEKYPDKVVLLLGNHDMHYVIKEFMNCSRLNKSKRKELHDLYNECIDDFNLVHFIEDKYLFSHAGLYEAWMDKYNLSIDELKDHKTFLKERWRTLEDCNWRRGGYDLAGSCVWEDIRESIVQDSLILHVRQIVGHTQLDQKPYITDNIACLDVRRCFILDTSTDEIIDA